MSRGRAGVAAAAVVGTAVFLGWWLFRRAPPQIGPDREAELAIDALFTALTARDEKLLAECGQRLHLLRDSEQLPPEAAEFIDGTIVQAQDGEWLPAAVRLYEFMKGQRRLPE